MRVKNGIGSLFFRSNNFRKRASRKDSNTSTLTRERGCDTRHSEPMRATTVSWYPDAPEILMLSTTPDSPYTFPCQPSPSRIYQDCTWKHLLRVFNFCLNLAQESRKWGPTKIVSERAIPRKFLLNIVSRGQTRQFLQTSAGTLRISLSDLARFILCLPLDGVTALRYTLGVVAIARNM
ncbi:uncharacterized protein LAESUDRAFT_465858 [Laetiporus sulphureus 93-53]|uniref:Uncharacterized protein n=1 Tax=Laetiporus sulphureus 93-53 TaxID=1314785 RepID=A0A165G7I6_9APHY|nr:uncharacterized protein LAESUDRAFT_465858 [Laetiporus sulphureus 93-53]KZT09936.1 hypothetical protein LAESUDRAFT_465858 [Laetiporus sulphureus 93-53]